MGYRDSNDEEREKKVFPPCNAKYNGTNLGLIPIWNVWCTSNSGGIQRNWVGVPRNYLRQYRCVCVKDFGDSLAEPERSVNGRGDLDNENLMVYDSCDPKSPKCQLPNAPWDDFWEQFYRLKRGKVVFLSFKD